MASGDVVFSRDLEDDKSDIWDDTALIKAYDEAVNSMKAHIAGKLGESVEKPAAETKKKHKKNRRKHKNKEKTSQPPKVAHGQWKIGDHCRAVYTLDGQIYEAVVTEIHEEGQTCIVRYLGYGNEEEHSLDDLLPSREHKGISDVASECDSVQTSQHSQCSSAMRNLRGASYHGSLGRGMGRGWAAPTPPPPPPPPSFMSGPGAPHMMGEFMPPMMPPLFPPTIGGVGFPGLSNMQMPSAAMPRVPDIPSFPTDFTADSSSDTEALHSMLISWYMSGYHTGYFQGLKQGKKTHTRYEGPSSSTEKPAATTTTEPQSSSSKQKAMDKDTGHSCIASD